MTGWNLPPGCEEYMIPGNRPEDIAWDKFIENNLEGLWEEYRDQKYDDAETELDKNPEFESYIERQFEMAYEEKEI